MIASRANPHFRALRDLLRDARRQRQEGRAVLEGPHLVAAALDHGVPIERVVLSARAQTHPEVTRLLARMGPVDALCLSDALFESLSELASPVGILVSIPVLPPPTFWPTGDCLLLDAVQDAGNVGTLLRTAAAAGVHDVLMGVGCAGAWTSRVLRAGQGAHFALRLREQVDLSAFLDAYEGCSVAGVAHGGRSLYGMDFSRPTAWLFGNEGGGVTRNLVARVNERVTIPLATGSESLNVAAAAAVCLFEMRRARTG